MTIYQQFGISNSTMALCEAAEKAAKPYFDKIEETAFYNQAKILAAFQKNRVSEVHFSETSGYGYDDVGRDTLDQVYADVFHCEDALVRHSILSGTHALALALFGVMRPGKTLLSVSGKPYDTLDEVIGLCGEEGNGSLKDWGVNYRQVELLDDGSLDLAEIVRVLQEDSTVSVAFFQRSKGYAWRKTLSVSEIGDAISKIKEARPDVVCVVDNCYGEFVEKNEPTDVGADLIVGSLIKNPGGGIAPTGGYVAGKVELVSKVAQRFTAPGVGKEIGSTPSLKRQMYQGFFLAPHVVSQALKSAVLSAGLFEALGYDVIPSLTDARSCIIQAVRLENRERLIAFCEAIQGGSPVDSYVAPTPWAMPGYQDEVIMAAGTFVQGASIELSADGPVIPPYTAYMQGGLTYESAKIALMMAAERVGKKE